jgi:L-histidine N-alpha-methyltransferase
LHEIFSDVRPTEDQAVWRDDAPTRAPDDTASLLAEVLRDLSTPQKTLPCRLFYDDVGSRLFDRITKTPEYYPTRTELDLLADHLGEISDLVGPDADLVELGSCNELKARLLLRCLERPRTYVPIDVAANSLAAAAQRLRATFPTLEVAPMVADFTSLEALPTGVARRHRTLFYFGGSTIGNFAPNAAVMLLASWRALAPSSSLLIGVDLRKATARLEAAYNDSAGYTAAFNLNILAHLNARLGADFEVARFEHVAYYDEAQGRVEMHLRSRADQLVQIGPAKLRFRAGETIHTENSYKYTPESFQQLASRAGFRPLRCWVDTEGLFSLHYLKGDAQ